MCVGVGVYVCRTHSTHQAINHIAHHPATRPRGQADVEDARLAAIKRPALLTAPPAALRRAAQEAGVP